MTRIARIDLKFTCSIRAIRVIRGSSSSGLGGEWCTRLKPATLPRNFAHNFRADSSIRSIISCLYSRWRGICTQEYSGAVLMTLRPTSKSYWLVGAFISVLLVLLVGVPLVLNHRTDDIIA